MEHDAKQILTVQNVRMVLGVSSHATTKKSWKRGGRTKKFVGFLYICQKATLNRKYSRLDGREDWFS